MLWRVVLVVLTIFGGMGLLIYLLAWLLLPADGDTASPVEALGGRGHSRTSAVRTIVGLVIAAIGLSGYFFTPYRATPLIALLILGGVLLLLLRDRSPGRGSRAVPPPYPAAMASTPAGPPFAPHGPFVPPPVPPSPSVVWTPPPPPPPRPRPPRSRLGGVTLSLAVLVVGALGACDLAGLSVPSLAYFAAPLAVLGLGLVVGGWFGRARWLIPFGVALALALGGGWTALQVGQWSRPSIGVAIYTPHSVSEIQDSYERNIGSVTLDLSDVDFTGRSVDFAARVGVGDLKIVLPSDVDVVIDANDGTGDADVLGTRWSGVGNEPRHIDDVGSDGPGGGALHITASVRIGSLEINR